MKIFQLSDLHLDDTFNFDEYKDMLEKMCQIIRNNTKDNETAYLICCGDIVNKGLQTEYNRTAKKIFDFIKSQLFDHQVEFIFVPGNHDLCTNSLIDYNNFTKKYNADIDLINNNSMLYSTRDFDFLLINTIFHKNIKYGNVDLEQFKSELKKSTKPVIVVMHHTFMSRYEDDASGIRNAYALLEELEKNNVVCVLHGHTHGFSNILIGNNCRVVGIGSLFKYFLNCNNQFNIIDITSYKVDRVMNYRYHSDINCFNSIVLYENNNSNNFEGNNIYELYLRVRDSVSNYGGMNHLNISLNTDISSYYNDMESNFSDDVSRAEMWLQKDVPDDLYYNHGSYINRGDVSGFDYIINELNKNSTSNHAILPLINFCDILKTNQRFLPGLTSIQFGFKNDQKDELICSMYLRSLEVKHFLRINLSEIYILIKKICNEFRSIQKINLNLYAFKAQYKENFSCFKKAQIDKLSSGQMSRIVYSDNMSELYDLLKDKFDMIETIVNTDGLLLLYDIMIHSNRFDEKYINSLKNVIDELESLILEYKKSSNYAEIKPLEETIQQHKQNCLEVFKQ